MKKTLFFIAIVCSFLSGCSTNDQYTGVWVKDVNTEFDKTAFPGWRPKGVTIPVDTGYVTTPVFIRIRKHMGGDYDLTCYLYNIERRSIVPDESVLGFVKFKKMDDYSLISDNEASHMVTLTKVTLKYSPGTQRITLHFPFEASQLPEDKKARAMFNSMFNSTFHKVADIHNKYETTEQVQKQLQEKKVVYE